MVDRALEILERRNLFLTGGAGTGKSRLTTEITDILTSRGRKVVLLGSTGISAVNIGGVTLHSFFRFGISSNLEELSQQDRRNRRAISELASILEETDLIVIDEISMVGAWMMDMIRYRLDRLGFNGKIMVVGDFFQLPPVRRREKNENRDLFSGGLYAFESDAWDSMDFETIELEEIRRSGDSRFHRILEALRRGEKSPDLIDYLVSLSTNENFGGMDPTWLFGRNLEVERTNRIKMDSLDGEEFRLHAEIDMAKGVSPKRIEKWIPLLPVGEKLVLKRGAPLLFCVNRWGKYANGERGVLRDVDDESLIVEKEDGTFVRTDRHTFELPEYTLGEDGEPKKSVSATFTQYPVRPAYAVTIHKSQGMSIESLVCNIDNIFTPSQFYVAISRSSDPSRLRIDYTRGNLRGYLSSIISVDERVVSYYERLKR
jgi:ATP-dependent exoDNAse (exonuclease V) alpha subunit